MIPDDAIIVFVGRYEIHYRLPERRPQHRSVSAYLSWPVHVVRMSYQR